MLRDIAERNQYWFFFSLTTDDSDLSNYCIYVTVKSTEQVFKKYAAIIARTYSIYLKTWFLGVF